MGLLNDFEQNQIAGENLYEDEGFDKQELESKKKVKKILEERLEKKRLKEELSDEFSDEFDWDDYS